MRILLTSNSFYSTPGKHHKALFEKPGITVDYKSGPLKESELLDIISKYDAVICGDDDYTERVLTKGASSKLKAISKYGIGLDKINVSKALELNIPVFNTPGVNHESVAEHVLALVLSYEKNIPTHWSNIASGNWHRTHGHELYSKSALIIGFGRIGKIVSKILKSFGAKIYVFEKYNSRVKTKYNKANMNFIFSNCDIISIHVDSRNENFNLIGKKLIDKMKKSAIFINTSRGEIVNEKVLISSLKKNKIAGAGLDVLDGDSSWGKRVKNNKIINYFKKNNNLIITPHLGGNTLEASNKTKELLIKKLISSL